MKIHLRRPSSICLYLATTKLLIKSSRPSFIVARITPVDDASSDDLHLISCRLGSLQATELRQFRCFVIYIW